MTYLVRISESGCQDIQFKLRHSDPAPLAAESDDTVRLTDHQDARLSMAGITSLDDGEEDSVTYAMSDEVYAYFQAQLGQLIPVLRHLWPQNRLSDVDQAEDEIGQAEDDPRNPRGNIEKLLNLRNVVEFQCRSALAKKLELIGSALPGLAFVFAHPDRPTRISRYERETVI